MLATRSVLSLWLIASMLMGCAPLRPVPPMPAYLDDPRKNPHPECPPEQSILAVGSSRSGLSDAKYVALGLVARQVDAKIEVKVEQVSEITRKNGETDSFRKFLREFKELSKFERSPLIKLVGAPGFRGEEAYVLACLDRARAAEELRKDLPPKLARFTAAYKNALQQEMAGDWPGFITAYLDAYGSAPSALALATQLSTVLGTNTSEEQELRRQLDILETKAADIWNHISFRMKIHSGEIPSGGEIVAERFRSAVNRFGRGIPVESSNCQGARRGTYLFEVTPKADCTWGPVGHTCQLRLQVEITECWSKRGVALLGISDGSLSGADRYTKEQALRYALEKLKPALLEVNLRGALASEVPFLKDQ